jgi:hypothetical protein
VNCRRVLKSASRCRLTQHCRKEHLSPARLMSSPASLFPHPAPPPSPIRWAKDISRPAGEGLRRGRIIVSGLSTAANCWLTESNQIKPDEQPDSNSPAPLLARSGVLPTQCGVDGSRLLPLRLLCRSNRAPAPGAPNSDSARFAGNRLFVPIRRSALRFPRYCMEAVSRCARSNPRREEDLDKDSESKNHALPSNFTSRTARLPLNVNRI